MYWCVEHTCGCAYQSNSETDTWTWFAFHLHWLSGNVFTPQLLRDFNTHSHLSHLFLCFISSATHHFSPWSSFLLFLSWYFLPLSLTKWSKSGSESSVLLLNRRNGQQMCLSSNEVRTRTRWQTNRRNALMWCRWKLGPDITAASCLRFSTQHHIWSRSRLVGRHAQGQRTVHGRSANQTALQYTSL